MQFSDIAVLSIHVLSVLGFCLAITLYLFLNRGARLRPEPWYASEFWLGGFLVPLVVVGLAGGATGMFQMLMELRTGNLHATDLIVPLVLPAVFAVVWVFQARAVPREEDPAPVTRLPTSRRPPSGGDVPAPRRAA